MPAPLAYFLTWNCYGSWLSGDPRGSVVRVQNAVGTPAVPHSTARMTLARHRMRSEPYILTDAARLLVDQAIRRHVEIRAWFLHALNVRTQHVHVVVRCGQDYTPETPMGQFKSWATRRLREPGFAGRTQDVWAEHGSTRWIDTDASLAKSIDYVLNKQD